MSKIVLIIAGTLSLAVGIIGIVVPGLPTTTFLLIAAACYFRSSKRLYNWLLNHKILGKYIKFYREHKAMPVKSKVIALTLMWITISISISFFIDNNIVRLVVFSLGLIGTVVILMVKTYRPAAQLNSTEKL